MGPLRQSQPLRPLALAASCALAACSLLAPDVVPVKQGPEGAVFLERLHARGTTVRYSSPLTSLRASHPVSFSPDVVHEALRGIHVGIAAADRNRDGQGIKPTPLFGPNESAFLASAVTDALERAEPDQLVRFQVGPNTDRTAGTLYVDNGMIRLALSQVHASSQTKDEPLSIYVLSFKPEQAQEESSSRRWIDVEPDQPRVTINYAALQAALPSGPRSPAASSQPSLSNGDQRPMKEVVERQAKELEALKTELEALKQQMQNQPAPPRSKPAPSIH